MKTESEIERDLKDEFEWDPGLDATDLAVSVKQGVVSLTGFVKSSANRYEAEAAAKRVAGVARISSRARFRSNVQSVDGGMS
jgi:osmotically-inducible protein OsmY